MWFLYFIPYLLGRRIAVVSNTLLGARENGIFLSKVGHFNVKLVELFDTGVAFRDHHICRLFLINDDLLLGFELLVNLSADVVNACIDDVEI